MRNFTNDELIDVANFLNGTTCEFVEGINRCCPGAYEHMMQIEDWEFFDTLAWECLSCGTWCDPGLDTSCTNCDEEL